MSGNSRSWETHSTVGRSERISDYNTLTLLRYRPFYTKWQQQQDDLLNMTCVPNSFNYNMQWVKQSMKMDCRPPLSEPSCRPLTSCVYRAQNPRLLDDVSFHPCVRFKRWEAERILSFIPPDGNFRLLSYHVSSQKSVSLSLICYSLSIILNFCHHVALLILLNLLLLLSYSLSVSLSSSLSPLSHSVHLTCTACLHGNSDSRA